MITGVALTSTTAVERSRLFQRAFAVLVDRTDPQRDTDIRSRRCIGRTFDTRQLSRSDDRDIRKDARGQFFLPEIGDGCPDSSVGLVELTLSASVTPAIDTVTGWFSTGAVFEIESVPAGAWFRPLRTTA